MLDFLKDLVPGMGQVGSFLGGVSQIAGLLGMGKDRISNRDYQFYQDLADSGNPREIARQSQFLEGLAPSQAAAHNTFQDATYQQDTQRATDRIQTMGSELGMSPWEIMGQSGSTPLPTPAAPQNQGGQFLSQLAPLKIAEINAKTQLATAKLQADTTLEATRMQTETSRYGTDVTADTARTVANIQTANGKVPLSQAELNAAQWFKTTAETALVKTQDAAARNQMYVNTTLSLAQIAGKVTVEMPGYRRETTNGAKELSEILKFSHMSPIEAEDYIKKMPADEWEGLNEDMEHVTEMALLAAGKLGQGAMQGIGGFLGSLFTEEHTERDDNNGKSSYTQKRTRFRKW